MLQSDTERSDNIKLKEVEKLLRIKKIVKKEDDRKHESIIL